MPEPRLQPAPATLPDRPAPAVARAHRWRFHRVGGLDQVVLEYRRRPRPPRPSSTRSCGWRSRARPRGSRSTGGPSSCSTPTGTGASACRKSSPRCLVRRPARRPRAAPAGRPRPALAAIPTATPEGRALLGGPGRSSASRGRPGAAVVTPADVADTSKVFARTAFNGDGILPLDAVMDPEARKVAGEVMACLGPTVDRSGMPGFDGQRLELFFDELQAFVAWWDEGNATEGAMPLGPATPAAWVAVEAVKARVDGLLRPLRPCRPRPARGPRAEPHRRGLGRARGEGPLRGPGRPRRPSRSRASSRAGPCRSSRA